MDIDENLLLQYLLGNVDETIRKAVDKWLDADGKNRKRLNQLETLWLETGKLDPTPAPVDLSKAWQRVSARIEKHEAEHAFVQKKLAGLRFIKYAIGAAAIILLVFGIYIISRILSEDVKDIELFATASILTESLPDGSRITLNKQTMLKYPEGFRGGRRLVKLTGEALFEVSKDPIKPFIVDAGIAKVKVLGTVFNVSAYPGRNVLVTVTEGRVQFFTLDPGNGDTLSIILESGMSGVLEPGALKPEVVEKPSPDKIFWANRTLDFNRTPLSEVFSLMEKYYDVKISVNSTDILNCRLTTTFLNDPIDRMMNVIAESFSLQLSVKDNRYYFNGNGCNKGNN